MDRLLRDYLEHWADASMHGLWPDRDAYADRLMRVLLDHYARITAYYTGRQRVPGQPIEDLTERARELRDMAQQQALLILDTIDNDFRETLSASKSAGWRDWVFKAKRSSWSIAIVRTFRNVRHRIRGRLDAIANMNTNGPVEDARAEAAKEGAAGAVLYKRWVTKQDERVRPTHVEMHGTMERVGVPFIVGDGHQMMQPGDTMMGAPLGEVINCRCWLEYFQRTDDGSRPEEDGTYEELPLRTPSVPTRTPRRPGAPLGSNVENRPTSVFTFTGRPTRGTIILGNGERASVTAGSGGITVRVGRRVIAEAQITVDAGGAYRVGQIRVDDAYRLTGVDVLIRNSVNATNTLRGTQ